MKLEDVVEVFPMLMPEILLDSFIFIWGREQCFKMSSEIFPKSHDYKVFEMSVLCLLWTSLWEGRLNNVD
jgi:hypothetical protein